MVLPALALGYPACRIPAILPLQSQILTSADTIDMSVLCPDGGGWRTLLTQPFKPFDNREWGSRRVGIYLLPLWAPPVSCFLLSASRAIGCHLGP